MTAADHFRQNAGCRMLSNTIAAYRPCQRLQLPACLARIIPGQNQLLIELFPFLTAFIPGLSEAVNGRRDTTNSPGNPQTSQGHQLVNPSGTVGQSDTGTPQRTNVAARQLANHDPDFPPCRCAVFREIVCRFFGFVELTDINISSITDTELRCLMAQ